MLNHDDEGLCPKMVPHAFAFHDDSRWFKTLRVAQSSLDALSGQVVKMSSYRDVKMLRCQVDELLMKCFMNDYDA